MSRFVILATARTGSNLLSRQLNQPPASRCFGEVAKEGYDLDPDAFTALSRLSGRSREELTRLQVEDVCALVYDVVFALPAPAVGFKLFYEHCHEPHRAALWRRLAEDRELRVVHLTRRAMLDCYLSLLYAQRTGEWLSEPGAGAGANDADDIVVDADHCLAHLRWHQSRQDWATRMFADHPGLEIDYADLSGDLSGTLDRVRAFVGARRPDIQSAPLNKQAHRAATDKIANIAELRERFRGTEFASLLDGS